MLAGLLLLIFFFNSTHAQTQNLFNGSDLAGWHVDVPKMDTDTSARNPFVVRNGMLVSMGKPGGHLITDAVFSNYRLEIEYRFAGEPFLT